MRWPWDRGPTLAEYAAAYLATARPRLAPSSYRAREIAYRLHILPRLGALRLPEIARPHIRGLIAGLLEDGLAPATVGHVRALLGAILAEAARDRLIARNPAEGTWREYRLIHPRDSTGRALTPAQVRALRAEADAAGPPWDALFGVLALTGVRLGEGLALRWFDVERDELRVHDSIQQDGTPAGHTKTRRDRVVDLSTKAVALLSRHRAWAREEAFRAGIPSPEWLFWRGGGRPLLARTVERQFRRFATRAGLPARARLHDLRHSFAVELLEKGARERYVQDQLGHFSIQMTSDLYGAAARIHDRKALEAMEL